MKLRAITSKLCICLLAIIAIFSLCGCASTFGKKGDLPADLQPQMLFKFSDIPAPSGFKLIPQDSYSFESAGVRVGVLKYKGKAAPERVVNFYKNQMPLYNWNLLNIVEYGDRMLNFDRDQESCIIRLNPGSFNSVTIIISVGPKAQTHFKKTDKKAEKPVK